MDLAFWPANSNCVPRANRSPEATSGGPEDQRVSRVTCPLKPLAFVSSTATGPFKNSGGRGAISALLESEPFRPEKKQPLARRRLPNSDTDSQLACRLIHSLIFITNKNIMVSKAPRTSKNRR
ncbi:hypothetical protein SBV1_550003 [Verrucomicrobia bacterium]|nr:hypothetical protein SBV1_550003 [Verrucomicrobiota bacterium]